MKLQGQEEFLAHQILDSKIVRGKLHYSVDWEGYSLEELSWEQVSNFHALDFVKIPLGLTLINLVPGCLEATLDEVGVYYKAPSLKPGSAVRLRQASLLGCDTLALLYCMEHLWAYSPMYHMLYAACSSWG